MSNNGPRINLFPPKAGSTTSTSRTSATSHAFQEPLRPDSRTTQRKNLIDTDISDATSDKITVALIRRVLCPDSGSLGSTAPQPLQDLLPPLTSSNDVDLQLYAIIAIIIKEFVYAWYAKITPDHVFVDETLQLIAHCSRALEQRLRQVDVAQLLLDELPRLVEAHIVAYRSAKQGSQLVSVSSSVREIYHILNPHPSLSPVPASSDSELAGWQRENEIAYRHLLAQGTLAVLLPTEDLENACLRTLVEDVLADLILGNEVSGRVCEGWFVWESISKVIRLATRRGMDGTGNKEGDGKATNRLERFGLLSTKEDQYQNDSSGRNQSNFSLWMWKTLYAIYLLYVTFRFLLTGLFRTAVSLPKVRTELLPSSDEFASVKGSMQMPLRKSKTAPRHAVLDYEAFGFISLLIDIPQRMPWLSGSLSLIRSLLLTGPGRLGDTDSILDRFLYETIQNYVLTPALLPTILVAARTSLFPSNARPQRPPANQTISRSNDPKVAATEQPSTVLDMDVAKSLESLPHSGPKAVAMPNEVESAAIKRQCAADILSLIPRPVARAFYGGRSAADPPMGQQESRKQNQDGDGHSAESGPASANQDDDIALLLSAIETDLLDPFSDAYCNKHLIFSVIETVLVRLLPELSERGITELMEERGVLFP